MEPNQIHQNIAQQVDSMKPDHLRPGIDVGMEPIDRTTLRVLLPYRGGHVDVRYDEGPDTYTVTRTDTVKLGHLVMPCEREPLSDVYCDQLGELVFGDDAKGWSQPFGGISTDGGQTWKEF
jgi:hypothetical protein